MEHGADDYLIKPFSARELLARVQTHSGNGAHSQAGRGSLREHRDRFDLVAQVAEVGFWFCDLPFDKLIWDRKRKGTFLVTPGCRSDHRHFLSANSS